MIEPSQRQEPFVVRSNPLRSLCRLPSLPLFIAPFTNAHTAGAPVDLDEQCGVINEKNIVCARSLKCKTHGVGAKRSVPGRSKPFDVLLTEFQAKKDAQAKVKAARESQHSGNNENKNPKTGKVSGIGAGSTTTGTGGLKFSGPSSHTKDKGTSSASNLTASSKPATGSSSNNAAGPSKPTSGTTTIPSTAKHKTSTADANTSKGSLNNPKAPSSSAAGTSGSSNNNANSKSGSGGAGGTGATGGGTGSSGAPVKKSKRSEGKSKRSSNRNKADLILGEVDDPPESLANTNKDLDSLAITEMEEAPDSDDEVEQILQAIANSRPKSILETSVDYMTTGPIFPRSAAKVKQYRDTFLTAFTGRTMSGGAS